MKRLSESGKKIFSACVIMLVLCTVAISSRFLVRKTLKQVPTMAEWLCTLSILLFAGYVGVMAHYIFNSPSGGEFNILLLLSSPPQVREALKTLFITEQFFNAIITAVKMSIIFFYYSIFSVSEGFTRALFVTGTLCLVWYLAATLLTVFQCNPTNAFWEMMAQPQYCQSSARVLLGTEISNLLLDVLILCLPIGMIRKLHLPTSRKLSVAGIFLLGSFVCAASIARLRYIWIPPNYDVNIDISMVMLWSTIQLGVAIICSCLPTYGPMFVLAAPLVGKFKKFYASITSQRGQTDSSNASWSANKQSSAEDSRGMTWQQIEDQSGNLHLASLTTVRGGASAYSPTTLPFSTIPGRKTGVIPDMV